MEVEERAADPPAELATPCSESEGEDAEEVFKEDDRIRSKLKTALSWSQLALAVSGVQSHRTREP